jgi:broad specificity phosphatase PhoE
LCRGDGAWYTKGWETVADLKVRCQRVKAWLSGLQSSLPDGDLVVVVSHGAFLGNLTAELLGTSSASFVDVANTSVGCFHLPNPSKGGVSFSVNTKGGQQVPDEAGFSRLEFFNQYPHLGSERMVQWATQRGLMRPTPKL